MDNILKHPYIAQFRDVKTETQSRKSIKPPVSDNKKLNLKQYRNLIYDSIKRMFPQPEDKIVVSIQRKNTSNSVGRSKEKQESRPVEYHSNSYHFSSTSKGFYNSLQRSSPKTSTMSYSNKKIMSHSVSQNNFYPNRGSYNED